MPRRHQARSLKGPTSIGPAGKARASAEDKRRRPHFICCFRKGKTIGGARTASQFGEKWECRHPAARALAYPSTPSRRSHTLWKDPGCQWSHPLHEESHRSKEEWQLTCLKHCHSQGWVSLPLLFAACYPISKMNGIFLWNLPIYNGSFQVFSHQAGPLPSSGCFPLLRNCSCLFPVCSPAPSQSCTWEPEPPTSGEPGDTPWVS